MTAWARTALVALAVAMAAVFVGQAVWPHAELFRSLLTEAVLLRLGSSTKLLLLGLAWHQSARCVRSLESENPARTPWRLFSLGLLGFFLGQAVLSAYQVGLGASPYPSLGDIFFMAAYPLLVLAAFGFVRAYREAGYPVGSRREHVLTGALLASVFLVVGVRLLGPVVAQPGPWLERFLTAAYPVFDFVLLVPILILLRITAPFRGGQVFTAWSLVLLGIVGLCAGDILYAHFTVMDREVLGPLVDATYLLAYLGIVLGAVEHRRLLAA
jgi:diguanylate cyclase